MKPVMRGLCRMESYLDGTLSIMDVAFLNDCLDVQDENDYRVSEARKQK